MVELSKLLPAGNNLSYLLSPGEEFSSTSHKMMQGMLENGFLPCIVYRYNGTTKLMYLAADKKPLSQINSLEDSRILDIVDSIAETAEQIIDVGFLTPENLAVSIDTVFVDEASGNCFFVYLPINSVTVGASKQILEKKAIDLINGLMVRFAVSASLRRLEVETAREGADLSSIRKVVSQLRSARRPAVSGPVSGAFPSGSIPILHLVGVNTPVPVDIILSKPEFIIGSSVNGVDGTMSFSRAISRVHCKFYIVESRIYIADMGSMNGTYVNGIRLQEGQRSEVSVGDRIRLANSDFELRRG